MTRQPQKASTSVWITVSSVVLLAFSAIGCQSWSGMGVPFNAARVPPPGTGSYGSSSNYYKGAGNPQAFQAQPAAAGGFVTNSNPGFQATGTQPGGVQSAGFVASSSPADNGVVPASASIGSSFDGDTIDSSQFGTAGNDEIPSMEWQP